MNPRLKKILASSESRADLISDLMDEFERLINSKGDILSNYLINDFLESLNTIDGNIKNDIVNLRKLSLIEKAYNKFQSKHGKDIVKSLLSGYNDVTKSNKGYYNLLIGTGVDVIDIKAILNYRLGLDSKGKVVKGGFLDNILKSAPAKELIKKELYKSIISGQGYESTKKSIKNTIVGNKDQLGEFQKYHRQVTYDTFVQIDRMENAIYAEKLGLKHFVFQGTRRKDSRHFCVERKGKAFSVEEAEGFKDLIDTFIYKEGKRGNDVKVLTGPIVGEKSQSTEQKKAAYEWAIDLGGYNCVDMCSFITEDLFDIFKSR